MNLGLGVAFRLFVGPLTKYQQRTERIYGQSPRHFRTLHRLGKEKMVGANGFEPSTSWSRTRFTAVLKSTEICGIDEIDCKAFAALVCVLLKRVDSESIGSYKIAHSSHHAMREEHGEGQFRSGFHNSIIPTRHNISSTPTTHTIPTA